MYFGLFRIGELTKGEHPVLACDVHIASNKKKILFILHTLKTHGKYAKPQQIKITSQKLNDKSADSTEARKVKHLPCPYGLLCKYLEIRGSYVDFNEPFFIFSDKSPVRPSHVRQCLKNMISQANFEYPELYQVHGIRAGCACDLLELGISVESIKKAGRWKSNAVYRYLK